jgi:hypothetical protein
METSFAQKYIALSRAGITVIHNYQPQAQLHYFLSSVLATSIETFGSHLFQELF